MSRQVNREALARKLMRGFYSLTELKCKMSDILALRDAGHRVNQRKSRDGEMKFSIPTEAENTSLFISGLSKKAVDISWLELSDLHAGSIQHDVDGLRQVLQSAVDLGIELVFIAGDLVDGKDIYKGHQNNLRYWRAEDQAQVLADTLNDFPTLRYIATHGNHDHSFEMKGSPNPVALVEALVPNMVYLRGFAGDVIIAGVCRRQIHGASGRAYAKSYPGQTYIRDLLDSQGEDVYVHGKKYRLRFLHIGHYHSFMTYESAGVVISHSGNFQFPNDYTIRRGLVGSQGGRIVHTVIQDGKVLEYTSTFIKPIR